MPLSPSLLSGAVALVVALALVAFFGIASLLSGILHFLFSKPSFEFLKSGHGEGGFAFGFFSAAADGAIKFDNLTIVLFNPFGTPTRREISVDFGASAGDFAQDIDMGSAFAEILRSEGFDKALVTFRISSSQDGISRYFEMKGARMRKLLEKADLTLEEYNAKNARASSKPLYAGSVREFIADPLQGDADRVLKLPTNPRFVPDFLGTAVAGAADGSAEENFAVKKVWIDPGCIVCDACEGVYPEVFEVLDDTCIIRENAPLDNGLLIEEAAEACPVEVIKFERA